MSGIRAEVKKEVYYYTTTYKLGNLFGDYCNMAVNLLLKWPNDGTSELAYTTLDGATNCGNIEVQVVDDSHSNDPSEMVSHY